MRIKEYSGQHLQSEEPLQGMRIPVRPRKEEALPQYLVYGKGAYSLVKSEQRRQMLKDQRQREDLLKPKNKRVIQIVKDLNLWK